MSEKNTPPDKVELQILALTQTATKMFIDKGTENVVIIAVIECFREGLGYNNLNKDEQKHLNFAIERFVNIALNKATSNNLKDLMRDSDNHL